MTQVLIVDDNRDAADSLGEVLRMMGHAVEVAYSASAALARMQRFHPDLFLLDLALPDLDGYELARRLRRVASKEAKFVAVSGYGSEIGGNLAGNLFDEHIVKPMAPEALLRVLRLVGHDPVGRGAIGAGQPE